MEIKVTCPLGHQCETAENNTISRCAWYIEIDGTNPQSEEIINEWRCSLSWMPMLQIEQAKTNRGQTAALESFRNETVKGQAEFNSLVKQSSNILGEQ
jgi:hypothetical protein